MTRKIFHLGVACLVVGSVLTGLFITMKSQVENPRPWSAQEAVWQEKEGERADRITFEERRLRDPATGLVPSRMRGRELEFAKNLPRRTSRLQPADKVTNGWEARGPGNIGGRVRALAIDVSDPTYRTLLAGGVSGGMWRSTNDGDTWIHVTAPGQLQAISCMVQDTRPGHENVFYYGTGEIIGGSTSRGGDLYRGDGIYKSTDGGLGWQVLPTTSTNIPQTTDQPFDYVQSLAIDSSETTLDEIYAATRGFIHRSVDGGLTWAAVLGNSDSPALYTDVVVSPTGVVYAAMSSDGLVHGVFRSENGVDWTNISPSYMDVHSRLVLALAPSNENMLYVTDSLTDNTSFNGIHKYTYLSGDGAGTGGLWIDRSSNLVQIEGTSYSYDSYYTQRGYNQCTTVHPDDSDLVFLGGVDLWRSSDGFSTKENIDVIGGWVDQTHHADVHRVVFQPGSGIVAYTATDGGIHKTMDITSNHVQWISLNNGFQTTQFYSVAVDQDLPGDTTIIGGTQDNGTLWSGSGDPGADWTMPLGGDGMECAVIDAAASPGEYIMSYYFNNIFRCQVDSDGKIVSQTLLAPEGPGAYDFLFVNPYIIDPAAEQVMYLGSLDGVWRNSNWWDIPLRNQNATSVNWVHLTRFPADEFVTALAVARTGDRSLFYGTETGKIYRVTNARFVAGSTAPTILYTLADFPTGAYVSGISIHPEDDQKILLCFSNYLVSSLWYSHNGGLGWTEVEGNLAGNDGPSVRAVNIMPFAGTDRWFIGTSIGVFSTVYSEGEPVVWELEAADVIGNAIVDALATRPSDGLVVAGTHGLGIYSVNLESASTVDLPSTASVLRQNYPNPFNPATTIAFDLAEGRTVTLSIHDASGRLIRTLLNGETRASGRQLVEWNGCDESGRSAAAGVYFYRLDAGDFIESRKMVLLK